MKYVALILINLVITIGVMNFYDAGKLGAFTQLNSGNNISDFPSTYNANLNKTIEVGTTSIASITTLPNLATANSITSASSLATVGTISSGVWNGTPITAQYGGTGSSTLSSNQVLLGNGTGLVKVVSGHGTTGQFLTSQGAGTAPIWSSASVNQTLDYTWTGEHSFTSATTTVADITTLNVTKLNIGTNVASSSVLSRDSSGNVYWVEGGMQQVASTTLTGAASSISVTFPARTMLKIYFSDQMTNTNHTNAMVFNDNESAVYGIALSTNDGTTASGEASSTASAFGLQKKGDTNRGVMFFELTVSNPPDKVKVVNGQGTIFNQQSDTEVGSPSLIDIGGMWANTTSKITKVTFRTTGGTQYPAGTKIIVYGSAF